LEVELNEPFDSVAAWLCTKSASPISEPEAVATGSIPNLRSLATILGLNIGPVATAPGSDTATPIVAPVS
jgi:hypothetical protein